MNPSPLSSTLKISKGFSLTCKRPFRHRTSKFGVDLNREDLLNDTDIDWIERERNGLCLTSLDDKRVVRATEGTRAGLRAQQRGALLAGILKLHVPPPVLPRNNATEVETPGSVLGHNDALHEDDALPRRIWTYRGIPARLLTEGSLRLRRSSRRRARHFRRYKRRSVGGSCPPIEGQTSQPLISTRSPEFELGAAQRRAPTWRRLRERT